MLPLLRRASGVGLAAGALTAGTIAWGAGPALAHDELIGSNPKDGASLAAAPTKVILYFEEAPGDGPTTLNVVGPTGSSVAGGAPVVSGSTVSAPLNTLTAQGRYTITFRIMSDDGHPVSGTLSFTLTATPAPATAAATSTRSASKHDSSALGWTAGGAVAAAVAIGAGTVVLRRRARV